MLGSEWPLTILFEHPTVRSLAARLAGGAPSADPATASAQDRAKLQRGAFARHKQRKGPGGMNEPETNPTGKRSPSSGWPAAGRGRDPRQLWRNVRDGIDGISQLTAEELEVAGAAELAKRADYVRARSVLDGVELFDAGFFGILPKEAELLDPQHRVFLECCWQALEDAGYDPGTYPGAIGVVAGVRSTLFLAEPVRRSAVHRGVHRRLPLGDNPTLLGAIADTLSTRVSYKLNLRGPSFTLQSACSTSLVAVSQACQSLLSYQSDMMLAGGSTITFPQKRGYLYQEGGMGSADGHCRPFEARAQGTVFGNVPGSCSSSGWRHALADGATCTRVIKGRQCPSADPIPPSW